MDISGSHRIHASPEAVRAGLFDEAALKSAITGCERLSRTAEGRFEGAAAAKVGPMKSMFFGAVTASDIRHDGWTLEAEGADPAAGSGRGSGTVTLAPDGDGTLVTYHGTLEAAGKIGQLGQRMVSGVARQAIEAFFTRFAEALPATPPPSTEAPPLVHEEPAAGPAPTLEPPPLAGEAGVAEPPLPKIPTAIAPTSVPDVPDPATLAAADAVEGSGGGAMTRIMLVAAVVVAVGIAIYLGFMRPPV